MPAYPTLDFTKEDVPPEVEGEEQVLHVAHVAGETLRALRKQHHVSAERACQLLKITPAQLSRAEAGNFVEVTRRGRLIDLSSGLLILLAVMLNADRVNIISEK